MRRRASIPKGNYLAPHWRRKWAERSSPRLPTPRNIWHRLRRGYKEKSSGGFLVATCPAHSNCDAWRDFRTFARYWAAPQPPAAPFHILLIGMLSNEVRHFRLFWSVTYLGRIALIFSIFRMCQNSLFNLMFSNIMFSGVKWNIVFYPYVLSKCSLLTFQGRCNREKPPCKYFHPPQHLKDQLLINGRNHLALKNALMQQMGLTPGQVMPGQVPAVVSVSYHLTWVLNALSDRSSIRR